MLLHGPSKSLLLWVDDPLSILELIPKSKLVDHPDYNVAVSHTISSSKVLRNIGLDVPAPIRSQYRWPGKYKPFDHQYVMSEFLTLHKRAFNLSEMGVGKSASALWAADWLMETKRVRKALILSPLSTLHRVWAQDIFDVLMHRKAVVLHGTREQRLTALKHDVDFYVLNHDGVTIKEVADAIRKRPDIDLVIVDEGSMFRNTGTQKFKALAKMLRPDMRVWWMSGTPCPNAPTDAYAQALIINPNGVPKFFGAFKRATMTQVTQFKWVPRPEAYNVAYAAMQPAVRFKKKDCLTLPPVLNVDRQADLTKDQRTAYKAMVEHMQSELKNETKTVTAVNAADKINKLRQILCGAVKDPISGDYIHIAHEPRVTVLLECIEQASAKVIVIVPFKGIIQELEKEVSKHHTCAVLNGDVAPRVRDKIIESFKFGEDPRVLLCHPKVMAHGLNLTEADMTVFYAPIYSNDEFQQVIERFNRAGQTRKMTIVRIGAHPLDWEIYKMVDNRKVTQENILNLYRSITE